MKRLVLLAALLPAACDQPPVKEIAAAEQQVAHARAAGADRYASERLKQADTALVVAHDRLRERDYQAALSAANDAAESARMAIQATGPAKSAARKQAEIAIAEIRTTLDRAIVQRDAALRAGVPKAALAALDALGQRATVQLAAASDRLAADDLAYVEPMVAELRTQATPLSDLYRDARTQWEAKHKPRRR